MCEATCGIVARLKILGLCAVPVNAYVREVSMDSVDTKIVDASNDIETSAIVGFTRIFAFSWKPILLKGLGGVRLHCIYEVRFRHTDSELVTARIAGRRLSISHHDLPYRHNSERQRLAVIVKDYMHLVRDWDFICRPSRRFHTVRVYKGAIAQNLFVDALREQPALFPRLQRVAADDQNAQHFKSESGTIQTAAEVFTEYAEPTFHAMDVLRKRLNQQPLLTRLRARLKWKH